VSTRAVDDEMQSGKHGHNLVTLLLWCDRGGVEDEASEGRREEMTAGDEGVITMAGIGVGDSGEGGEEGEPQWE
jgi:hypothetical protein